MPSLLVVVAVAVLSCSRIFASGEQESRFAGTTAYQAEKKSGANLNSRSVNDSQSYQSHLVKWLILENEKKTTVSQFWRKKGKTFNQKSFRLMVSYQKMMVLKFKQIESLNYSVYLASVVGD